MRAPAPPSPLLAAARGLRRRRRRPHRGAVAAVVATTGQAADFAREVGGDRGARHRAAAARTPIRTSSRSGPTTSRRSPARTWSCAPAATWTSGSTARSTAPAATRPSSRSPTTSTLVDDDPHWWQDPGNAIAAVAAIRDALAAADPARRGLPTAPRPTPPSCAGWTARSRACIDRIPVAQRTLVTTHDALGYYARRYGIRVVGAVIPSRSTRAQPSAGEVDALVDTIRREHVRRSSPRARSTPTSRRRSRTRPARPSGGRCGPTRSGRRTRTARPTSSRSRRTPRAIVDGLTGGEVACRPSP